VFLIDTTKVYYNSNGLYEGTHAGSKAVLNLWTFTIKTINAIKTLQVVYNISRASVRVHKAFRNYSRKVKCMLYQNDHGIVNENRYSLFISLGTDQM